MEEIMKEKAQFIIDNKTLLIDNINIIKFDLFKVLNINVPLKNMKEYKTILKSLEHKRKININDTRDAVYIIYLLSHFLDKITMDQIEKEQYRDNLFRYVDYLTQENEKKLIKTGFKRSNLSA